MRCVDARRAQAHVLRRLLDALSRGDENRDAALLLVHALEKLVVEELADVLAHDLDLRRLLGIERIDFQHVRTLEVLAIKSRIDGGRQPDEPAADTLAEREAELEFGRRLVNFIHDERVARQDVAVLEPATRDAGGDDDDVPARRVGRRLALAIDHAHAQYGRAQQFFGDRSNRERFSRSGTGDDAKSSARARQLAYSRSEVFLEVRLDVESDGELDRLAGRTRGGDDDDASRRRFSPHECFVVGGEVLVSYFAHAEGRSEIRARPFPSRRSRAAATLTG